MTSIHNTRNHCKFKNMKSHTGFSRTGKQLSPLGLLKFKPTRMPTLNIFLCVKLSNRKQPETHAILNNCTLFNLRFNACYIVSSTKHIINSNQLPGATMCILNGTLWSTRNINRKVAWVQNLANAIFYFRSRTTFCGEII